MLAIKLQRIGKKHQPSYRVIVQEKREKLGAPAVEDVGWWNPLLKKHELNKERALHWMKIGAQPTSTVHNLFITAGIIEGKKIAVHKQPKKKEEAALAAPTPAVPAPGGEQSKAKEKEEKADTAAGTPTA